MAEVITEGMEEWAALVPLEEWGPIQVERAKDRSTGTEASGGRPTVTVHTHDGDGTNSTIIGGESEKGSTVAVASGSSSLAAGDDADATGTRTIAVGRFAQATDDFAIAIGAGTTSTSSANATANGALAVGTDALASAINTIAIGNGSATRFPAIATAAGAIKIGSDSGSSLGATAADAIAVGTSAQASKANAIVLGINAAVTTGGNASIAIGSAAAVTGGTNAGISIGSSSLASGNGAICVGTVNAQAGGTAAVAVGENAIANGANSTAVAGGATSAGARAAAFGNAATASGQESIAIGDAAAASQRFATAIGDGSSASAVDATAIGRLSVGSGQDSVAVGRGAQASATQSTALGSQAVIDSANQVMLGTSSDHVAMPGGQRVAVNNQTMAYQATLQDYFITGDASGGDFDITLPAIGAGADGTTLRIKNIGSSGTVTVEGSGAETIDGAANVALDAQYESIDLAWSGTEWSITDSHLEEVGGHAQSHDHSAAGDGVDLNPDSVDITDAGKTALQLSSTGADTGITIGGDVELYRPSANLLTLDDNMDLGGNLRLTASSTISQREQAGGFSISYATRQASNSADVFFIMATGEHRWSDGASAFDTNLRRAGANLLQTDDKFKVALELEVDGDLNHDGSNVGFYGTAPVAQSAAYTPTNYVEDRSYDADATSTAELADILGTLISDLQALGLIG